MATKEELCPLVLETRIHARIFNISDCLSVTQLTILDLRLVRSGVAGSPQCEKQLRHHSPCTMEVLCNAAAYFGPRGAAPVTKPKPQHVQEVLAPSPYHNPTIIYDQEREGGKY